MNTCVLYVCDTDYLQEGRVAARGSVSYRKTSRIPVGRKHFGLKLSHRFLSQPISEHWETVGDLL